MLLTAACARSQSCTPARTIFRGRCLVVEVVLVYWARLKCAVQFLFQGEAGERETLTVGYGGERHQVVDPVVVQTYIFLVRDVVPHFVLKGNICILVFDGNLDGWFLPHQKLFAFRAPGG